MRKSFLQIALGVLCAIGSPARAQLDCVEAYGPDLALLTGHTMAYDSHRGVTMLYGGQLPGGGAPNMGTWEWDGTRWARRTPPGGFATPEEPGGSDSQADRWAMAYDSARRVMVLFGRGNTTYVGETWEWGGTAWIRRSTPVSPPTSSHHSMVFDSGRGVCVLLGGSFENPPQSTFTTWEWDGTVWTQRTMAGPTPYIDYRIAYDAARQRTVYFGGMITSSPNVFSSNTWEYDGTAWSLRASTGPSPRHQHAMAFDSARGVTVLHGGLQENNNPSNETWEWDGTVWTRRLVASATSRNHHAMAYDSGRQRMVLFGGIGTGANILSDTWEWTGSGAWSLRASAASPRHQAAMAYDAARQRSVLTGGNTNGNVLSGETWLHDGNRWFRPTGPNTTIPPRMGHAMAYDSVRGVVVLFGGRDNEANFGDTLEWDGSTWADRGVAGPAPRYGHALAFDSTRGVTVLVGGQGDAGALGDTWEWDGTVWTQRAIAGPTPRQSMDMAYDAARQVMVLAGGALPSGQTSRETWEYDGAVWTLRTTTGVSFQTAHVLAYAPERGGVFFPNTYWSGSAWLPAPFPPVVNFVTGMAGTYDAARRSYIYFGGGGNSYSGLTYFADALPTGISVQPPAATVPSGAETHFTGEVTRLLPRSYQWRRNGAVLPALPRYHGATTPMLTIDPVLPSDAGAYDLVVTYTCGPVVSATATLTVICRADWNGSGSVDPVDVGVFISDWFESVQTGQTAGDYDGNGAAEPADIGVFVSDWFAAVQQGSC